jgi:hypothetical protein
MTMEAPASPAPWTPPPEDGAALPAFLDPLVERLAERVHDRWARQRMAEGWTYGPVRDEAARRTPNLVAYADLTESEREVDRATATATLQALYAEGCQVVAGGAAVAHDDPAAASVALALADPDRLDFGEADRLRRAHGAAFWAAHPDLLLRLARRASDAGWPLMVFDLVSQALALREADPACVRGSDDSRLLHLEVLSLMEIGALERAAAELGKLASRDDLGGDLPGLQGRLAKMQGLRAPTPAVAREHFAEAGRIYFAAYGRALERFRATASAAAADDAYYLGVNAATMRAWSGREADAAALAGDVLALCDEAQRLHAGEGPQPWLEATRGEAHLLRRESAGAAAAYRAAAASLGGRWRPLQSMRRQALETARRTGFPVATVEEWFALPGLHVAGLGGSPVPPADGRPIVFQYVSVPADLEQAAALAGRCTELHLCFERPLEEFRADLDAAASARLDGLLASATRVVGQREMQAGGAETTPVFTRLFFRGLALLRASELDLVPSGLPSLAACGVEPGRELPFRAMLFADAKGYSRLGAEGLRTFVRDFLGEIGRVVEPYRDRTVTVKTAGDGLFIVFRDVSAAIRCSLELRDRTAGIDWVARGFPGDLGLRISLDGGPVMEFLDPVSRHPDVAGQLVNRAARIEPVTPVNHVYASRTMAALALALDVGGVRFEYAGETPLPKKFGTLQLYHVARG